jgi:hypothetical protein
MNIPQPKLPHITLPTIRSIPTIPHVGCAGGDGTSYVGKQFGNVPDLHAVLHIRTVKKALAEQIYALLKGQLPFATRPPFYDARMVQLTNEVAELTEALTSIVSEVSGDINDAINFVGEKITAMNELKNAIAAVPEQARSAVDRLMFERYGRYAQELNAQKHRLQSTLDCVTS